jgi:CRISPR-associated endonuclease Csn1
LGAQVLKRAFAGCEEKPSVISLPGPVTGTVRKAWKLLGCLGLANPQVLDENGGVKTKTDIRDITHLHHALDACVLGLASHFIPNNGRVWELIVKRNLNDLEKQQLQALGIFDFNAQRRFEMRELDDKFKDQIRQRLAEKRVVQHIPARMDGLRVEQNTWRVVAIKDNEIMLRQRIRQPDGTRPEKVTEEKPGKLLGPNPMNGNGKLAKNKGALVIPDNFGVALDPQPTVIPFHKVWTRLQELKNANGGKMPRVLRNGQIIQVPKGRYRGIWRVFSAKASLTLDLGAPDKVRLENKGEGQKREVQIKTLLKDGMAFLKTPLTGIDACPTTSSA